MAKKAERFGCYPLCLYLREFNGMTRGQVKKADPSYYQHLLRTEFISYIPLYNALHNLYKRFLCP